MLQKLLLKFSRRWIGGETRRQALEKARKLNKRKVKALINFLGEHYTEIKPVEKTKKEYLELIDDIKRLNLDACISVKLSEFGLDISDKICRKELKPVLQLAKQNNIFVWFDMESHDYTDKTIQTYLYFLRSYKNTGIAIQAALRRSEKDVKTLLKNKHAIIRLVKGAYAETPEIAFKSRMEIRDNFSKLMDLLFKSKNYFAIATHDPMLIELAKYYNRPNAFEFQMLMGVKTTLKNELLAEGFKIVEYVPYGKNWFAYVTRRLMERKMNILYVIKSLFE